MSVSFNGYYEVNYIHVFWLAIQKCILLGQLGLYLKGKTFDIDERYLTNVISYLYWIVNCFITYFQVPPWNCEYNKWMMHPPKCRHAGICWSGLCNHVIVICHLLSFQKPTHFDFSYISLYLEDLEVSDLSKIFWSESSIAIANPSFC